MNQRMAFSIMFPILAVLTIVVFAGGLGILFMVLEAKVVEEWAVVGVGASIVILVPAIAALIQNRLERS